jgi:hypothetical protein
MIGRDVCYLTFGDVDLVRDGYALYNVLLERHVTVGQLYGSVKLKTKQYSSVPNSKFVCTWQENWFLLRFFFEKHIKANFLYIIISTQNVRERRPADWILPVLHLLWH